MFSARGFVAACAVRLDTGRLQRAQANPGQGAFGLILPRYYRFLRFEQRLVFDCFAPERASTKPSCGGTLQRIPRQILSPPYAQRTSNPMTTKDINNKIDAAPQTRPKSSTRRRPRHADKLADKGAEEPSENDKAAVRQGVSDQVGETAGKVSHKAQEIAER